MEERRVGLVLAVEVQVIVRSSENVAGKSPAINYNWPGLGYQRQILVSHLFTQRQSRVYRLQAASELCGSIELHVSRIMTLDNNNRPTIACAPRCTTYQGAGWLQNINIWVPRPVHLWCFEWLWYPRSTCSTACIWCLHLMLSWLLRLW